MDKTCTDCSVTSVIKMILVMALVQDTGPYHVQFLNCKIVKVFNDSIQKILEVLQTLLSTVQIVTSRNTVVVIY